jgi:hypothetical protein
MGFGVSSRQHHTGQRGGAFEMCCAELWIGSLLLYFVSCVLRWASILFNYLWSLHCGILNVTALTDLIRHWGASSHDVFIVTILGQWVACSYKGRQMNVQM